MSSMPSDAPPWSFVQWLATAVMTAIASSVTFGLRLARRVERFESALEARNHICDSNAVTTDNAFVGITGRLEQIRDDYFRIRETINGLSTRSELRDVEDRIIDQLSALSGRIDRTLERNSL